MAQDTHENVNVEASRRSSKNVDSENVTLMLEPNSTVVTVHSCRTSRSLPGAIETSTDQQANLSWSLIHCDLDLIIPDIICKFCLKSDSRINLIKPCQCKGSKSFAHRSCLITFLQERHTRRCKDCTFYINVKTSNRSLRQWTIEPGLYSERLTILTTFSIHLYTSVILAACSATLLSKFARKDSSEERLSFIGLAKLVTGIGLAVGLIVFLLYHMPHYYKIYNIMRCYNNPVLDVFDHDKRVVSSGDNRGNSEGSFVALLSKFSSVNRVSAVIVEE
ncbi:hypothetical protein ACHWQZ_G000581 [Mnemiopsis leidyi]